MHRMELNQAHKLALIGQKREILQLTALLLKINQSSNTE